MSLENKRQSHDQQVVDKYQDPRAPMLMTTRDYVMRPYANNANGALTIVLPPVNDAKGRFYSIVARDADVVNVITITDLNDSECWLEDIVLNAPCQSVLLYSDGFFWHAFGVNGRPGLSTTIPPETANPTTLAPTTLATTVAPTTVAPTTAAP